METEPILLLQTTTPPLELSNKSPSTLSSPLCQSQKPNLMDPLENTHQVDIDGWDEIRELDDVENWSERTRVISKQDHEFYTTCANQFVSEMINQLPTNTTCTIGEESDYGILDANEEIQMPATTNPTYDFDYMNEFSDKDFQTSAAQLDIDYLEKMSTHTNPSVPSALTRESLYVKFDPLVGSSLSKKGTISTPFPPSGDNLIGMNTPPQFAPPLATSSTIRNTPLSTTYNLINVSDSPELSMNNGIHRSAQLNKTSDHGRLSSPIPRTLLDSSPSAGYPLSQGGANDFVQMPRTSLEGNTELVKVLKYSEADIQQIILQIRQECQVELERQVADIKDSYSQEVSNLQKKMDRLVKELQNLRANRALQSTSTAKLEEEITKLKNCCTEHEETETKCLEMYEKLKEESKQVEKQRDQALADFSSLEKSFAEFHQRHIKARETVNVLQKSEESLQQYISDLETKLDALEQLNEQLQLDAQLKIQEANKIYEKLQNEHASEIAVMKANVKKMTVQISSLERQLQQKEQEKSELTQICEDLMKELGNR